MGCNVNIKIQENLTDYKPMILLTTLTCLKPDKPLPICQFSYPYTEAST